MNQEIQTQLEKIAYEKSIPFCYGCYEQAPSGVCKTCMSDDLMRLVPAVGCEYGVDWVIKHLLEENLSEVDLSEAYEQFMSEVYAGFL